MEQAKTHPDIQTITKEEVLSKVRANQRVQILNVLAPEHYGLGFIKGSIKIPLEQLEKRLNELDKNKEIITYCASHDCHASQKAAQKLSEKGFNVKAYEGGIKEWKQSGLPTEEMGLPKQEEDLLTE